MDYARNVGGEEAFELVNQAYVLADRAHVGQYRKSGEPYVNHCVVVAGILKSLNADPVAIAAGLLHDVVEETAVTLDQLKRKMGVEVASLVDGMTKLDLIEDMSGRPYEDEAESFRKMFLAMANDLRVVLIKLADRLHNMRTVDALSVDRRQRLAKETLEVWAPLASRLGIWQIQWELEDLGFRHLNPQRYHEISSWLTKRQAAYEATMSKIINRLSAKLAEINIEADISNYPKHIYSIWKRIQRRGVPLEHVYDVRTIRVIVKDIPACYVTLGIIHGMWKPIPGEFNDYIATPKDDIYQSLHTTVVCDDGKTLQVQIRAPEMDTNVQYGVTAYSRYSADDKQDLKYKQKAEWLRQLMERQQEANDAHEFLDSLKTDVFQDQIYTFTPKGDIITLPQGATPIDFAYYIHTEVGHRCRGARVSGRLVSLDYQLANGDQVEILTSKRGGPSRDWLNPYMGFVKTSRARSKIRNWFKRQEREDIIKEGRSQLNRELKRLGLTELDYEQLAAFFNYDNVDDFLSAFGVGDITIVGHLAELEAIAKENVTLELSSTVVSLETTPTSVRVSGTNVLLNKLGRCCNPLPGDAIVGYITRKQGITVHRQDCPKILNLSDQSRLVEVQWRDSIPNTYPVTVVIDAHDRPGLLRDITTIVAGESINMSAVNVVTNKRDHTATTTITLNIISLNQLSGILTRIEQLPNVVEVKSQEIADMDRLGQALNRIEQIPRELLTKEQNESPAEYN